MWNGARKFHTEDAQEKYQSFPPVLGLAWELPECTKPFPFQLHHGGLKWATKNQSLFWFSLILEK